ncbi:MAG: hypothetical protein COS92_05340 [Desulfobacterales bacterium CG07_land_8_20_14_0_80_52_14]|nr:MAG: hypothetical protein COX20_03515 [Desulfobacterales bacterium CG23_combo_of_CG06-09_8_20_14_all_52_9]PIU49683.1 MAG: hypothetical protein COS92_05340 [Desulfobacterales bacterium CG07_land_8_20_14_0_80_52_14]
MVFSKDRLHESCKGFRQTTLIPLVYQKISPFKQETTGRWDDRPQSWWVIRFVFTKKQNYWKDVLSKKETFSENTWNKMWRQR